MIGKLYDNVLVQLKYDHREAAIKDSNPFTHLR